MKEILFYSTDFDDIEDLTHETVDDAIHWMLENVDTDLWPLELEVGAYVRADVEVSVGLAERTSDMLIEDIYDDLGGPAQPRSEKARVLDIVKKAIAEIQSGAEAFHCNEDRGRRVTVNLLQYTADSDDDVVLEWRRKHLEKLAN